jgi:diguanylate cyclase (GGDEF)-like protein/PAS domain S-box-containing protein
MDAYSSRKTKLTAYLPVVLVVCMGIALSIAAHRVQINWDRDEAQLRFENRAMRAGGDLKDDISADTEILHAMDGFYSGCDSVERDEFRTFVRHVKSNYTCIQALEWIPLVPRSKVAKYESAAQRDGFTQFHLTERLPSGKSVMVRPREEYFPVYYVEPYKGNEKALGYDLASDPARRAALMEACNTGRQTATSRVHLVQETREQHGVLIFQPIYLNTAPRSTVTERRANLTGFVLGVFRIGDMVNDALKEVDITGMEIYLCDESAKPGDRLLYARASHPVRDDFCPTLSGHEDDAGPCVLKPFMVGGHRWCAMFTPSAPLVGHTDSNGNRVLAGGLLCTALLAGYLLTAMRRSAKIAQLATELTLTNEDLTVTVHSCKVAETALRESETRYRQLVELLPDAIIVHSNNRILFVNQATVELLGARSSQDLIGSPALDIVHPDHRDRVSLRIERARSTNTTNSLQEQKLVRKDGSVVYAESLSMRFTYQDETAVLVVLRDITERKQAEAELHLQISALNGASDHILIADAQGNIEFVNASFHQDTGFTKEDIKGRLPNILRADGHSDEFYETVWHIISSGSTWRGELSTHRRDGRLLTGEVTITPVKDTTGNIEHFVAIARDVTEKKMHEQQLYALAHHDSLTGLPNRLQFSDRLRCMLADTNSGALLGVLFLDLDHFKLINDTLGHTAGDYILKAVAERLKSALHGVDTIARMSGDEFIIMTPPISNRRGAIKIAKRALAALSDAFTLDGHEFFITGSIGISFFPTDGTDVETLVRNADTAMYRAKELGRNRYQLYEKSFNVKAVERVNLESSLRRALERDEFAVWYQPVMDISTGRIIAAEALIRWQHPELGLVSPDQFIPLAEETGLIVPITEWVVRTACSQARAWQISGYKNMGVGVNISPRQFQQKELIRTVTSALREDELEPRSLTLELTESALMQNPLLATELLSKLKAMGIRIAIDDFGTGYSSLSYLKRFPVDIVKIDQSFVKNLPNDPDDSALVGAIVAMGHSLKLKVLAEGVETSAQLEFLASLKCDSMQGYFLSRPLPTPQFTQLLIDSGLIPNPNERRAA